MGTVLIYDWDYFHYSHVIPNLECAKLAAWRKNKKDITVFTNNFEPSRYTKVYFRKEYEDGIYDNSILLPNVDFGGRAFSNTYKPFELDMENIVPDFSIYENYKSLYGNLPRDEILIKTILYATHVRLSLDGEHLDKFPFDRLQSNHPCIILHDYDISSIPQSYDLLYEVCSSRPKGRPYGIGNKYPIQIYDYEELKNWLDITPMGNLFYIQYNGVFTDEELIDLVENKSLIMRQLSYNFLYNCHDESEFMIKVLPKIYKQALFLRRKEQRILLNIDDQFFKTKELYNLMKLINGYFSNKNINRNSPRCQTLYAYCASKKREVFQTNFWVKSSIISKEEMREAFQYIREHNYEVFDMFYSWPAAIEKGGKIVNEWE